tara:strand:+ start:1067 stop:1336 length:270 start_codon:yes stop_codon:yes gene_type:complete
MSKYDDKPLNKPFKSPIKTKKYTIIIMDKNKKRKVIHFGARGMQQYKDKIGLYSSLDSLDESRRKAFYDRFGKTNDKTSALYYSAKYLW